MIELTALPHAEAIAYFQSKGYAQQLQRFHHLDHFREEHARDLVVAKAMRNEIMQLFRDELQTALQEGRSEKQFIADLEPLLRKEGWWGRQQMTDPLTGETQEVQLGSVRRLRTIYDTNMRTAHAAGHWARIQRTSKAFPYLHYIQIERPSKRDDHARFHDKIWRVDDPIWLRIYPPNGFFCGCHVIQRTEGWMKRNNRIVSEPVDLEERAWTNKRSGETVQLPRGVHPGFDTNPGATWLDIEAAADQVMPELADDRRARERGLLQALRLRQMAYRRETLIISDARGTNLVLRDAEPELPDRVSIDTLLGQNPQFPSESVDLLHSHLTDAPLSYDDLLTLGSPRVRSITAISPGGALWRARPAREPLRAQFSDFARQAKPILDEMSAGMAPQDRTHVVQHALGLYLERRGVIHYRFSLTGRLRDLFEQFSDLIERLSS